MRLNKFLLIACLASCSPNQSSETKEAPDSRNLVSRFQIQAMPYYDELSATTEVFTVRLPWSDTYWPLTQTGIARRWGKVGEPSPLNFSSFWKDQYEAVKSSTINPLLSPGEKYDLVFRIRHNRSWSDTDLKQQIDKLASIEASYQGMTDLTQKRQKIDELAKAFVENPVFTQWSPMAANGWSQWLNYTKNPRYQFRDEASTGDAWDWMGYCHGWAPAALMHEAPKHSVMAKIRDKEIFFGEGDIRGLLTIAWAEYSPSSDQYFLGRRCNENTAEPEGTIPASQDARGVTGTFKNPQGEIKTFTMIDEYLPGAAASGRRIYHMRVEGDESSRFLVELTLSGKATYFIGSSTDELKIFVDTGSTAGLKAVTGVKFYGCWDVNPASFHTVLTEYLGKKNLGIVMDRTRTGQVWNQPVHGAKFVVGPLLEAATIDDPLFRYRAPGTVYLAEVKTEVHWSSEPAKPSLDYADDFDLKRMRTSQYVYTLEFDANKQLIGGEWGDLGPVDPKMVIPDFIYAFKEGSVPRDTTSFDFSGIIKPLLDCSLDEDQAKIKTMSIDGKVVKYSDCEIAVR